MSCRGLLPVRASEIISDTFAGHARSLIAACWKTLPFFRFRLRTIEPRSDGRFNRRTARATSMRRRIGKEKDLGAEWSRMEGRPRQKSGPKDGITSDIFRIKPTHSSTNNSNNPTNRPQKQSTRTERTEQKDGQATPKRKKKTNELATC